MAQLQKNKKGEEGNVMMAEAHNIRNMTTGVRYEKDGVTGSVHKENCDESAEEEDSSPVKKKHEKGGAAAFVDKLKQTEAEELVVMEEEQEHRHELDERRLELEEKRFELKNKCFEEESRERKKAAETRRKCRVRQCWRGRWKLWRKHGRKIRTGSKRSAFTEKCSNVRL